MNQMNLRIWSRAIQEKLVLLLVVYFYKYLSWAKWNRESLILT